MTALEADCQEEPKPQYLVEGEKSEPVSVDSGSLKDQSFDKDYSCTIYM